MAGHIAARLEALGLTLPPHSDPVATYVPVTRSGNVVYVAGHGPRRAKDPDCNGRLGDDLTTEQGYRAARWTALAILGSLQHHLGDLDRIQRFLKVLGMVQSHPDYHDQPKVINGFSDLIVELFGPERGLHARSAVGLAALPSNIAVEIECIVEVRDD
jgi:enamine deaminase RidA (YjgF/YER057c/UK114 family)